MNDFSWFIGRFVQIFGWIHIYIDRFYRAFFGGFIRFRDPGSFVCSICAIGPSKVGLGRSEIWFRVREFNFQ